MNEFSVEGACYWADLDPRSGNYLLVGVEGKVLLYNRNTNTLVHTYGGHYGPVNTVAIASDNTILLSNSHFSICHWDVSSGRLVRKLNAGNLAVNHLDIHARDKNLAASASLDCLVRIWDLRMQKLPVQILEDAKDSVTRVHIRDDTIVTSSLDGCIRQYDIRKGQVIDDYFKTGITASDVTKDGALGVACLENKGVVLIDLEEGKELKTMHSSSEAVVPLCWCGPTDEYIAVSEKDTLFLYDIVSSDKPKLSAKVAKISSISYRHNNLICASLDGKVTVLPLNNSNR